MTNKKSSLEGMVDEVVEDSNQEVVQPEVPHYTEPEWVEFILDQLADHELSNGNPTTDGIRRVAEKYFGEIVYSDTEVVEVPKVEINGKATAKHTLRIRKYDTGEVITVSACIDVLGSKLPYPFKEHLVSTACTRAEGKALRRALKVRILTAEELAHSDEDGDSGISLEDPINDQQVLALKTMCKRLDVDIIKFVKANARNVKNIKAVKSVECALMINKLSEYQRAKVPEEFSGWSDSWESKFGGN